MYYPTGFFDTSDVNDLVKESLQMKEFSHPNVMGLIGICLDAGPAPYIILPFMSAGSLLSYLKERRNKLVVTSEEGSEEVW